jgi:hypothetical protein
LDKEDITLEVLPLFLKGLRLPSCSLPVKNFISECMANSLAKQANHFLRQIVQEIILREFAISETSQIRMVFLHFLEKLLP